MIDAVPAARGEELVGRLDNYLEDPTFRVVRLPVSFDQFCDLRGMHLVTFVAMGECRPAYLDQPYYRGHRLVIQGEK